MKNLIIAGSLIILTAMGNVAQAATAEDLKSQLVDLKKTVGMQIAKISQTIDQMPDSELEKFEVGEVLGVKSDLALARSLNGILTNTVVLDMVLSVIEGKEISEAQKEALFNCLMLEDMLSGTTANGN